MEKKLIFKNAPALKASEFALMEALYVFTKPFDNYNNIKALNSIETIEEAQKFLSDINGYFTEKALDYITNKYPEVIDPEPLFNMHGLTMGSYSGANDLSNSSYFSSLFIEHGCLTIPNQYYSDIEKVNVRYAETHEELATLKALERLQADYEKMFHIVKAQVQMQPSKLLSEFRLYSEHGINPVLFDMLVSAGIK